jgi:integrase
VQRWLVHLLTRYSDAYASNQFRALQQFFRWLAEEEQLPDPMARLRAPKVTDKLVPVFTSEELSRVSEFLRQVGEGFLIAWWAGPVCGRPADARLAPVALDRLGGSISGAGQALEVPACEMRQVPAIWPCVAG